MQRINPFLVHNLTVTGTDVLNFGPFLPGQQVTALNIALASEDFAGPVIGGCSIFVSVAAGPVRFTITTHAAGRQILPSDSVGTRIIVPGQIRLVSAAVGAEVAIAELFSRLPLHFVADRTERFLGVHTSVRSMPDPLAGHVSLELGPEVEELPEVRDVVPVLPPGE